MSSGVRSSRVSSCGSKSRALAGSVRASFSNPEAKASGSTVREGCVARTFSAECGDSKRSDHCSRAARRSSGTSAANSLASRGASADKAARVRLSASAGVSSPCWRNQANTSAHSAGGFCGTIQRLSAAALKPCVSLVDKRPSSRSQINTGSATSAERGKNQSQRRRCARLVSQSLRRPCVTGCPACERRKASIAASNLSSAPAARSRRNLAATRYSWMAYCSSAGESGLSG